MGPVTTYLVNLIKRQVNEHKLVLWFDPEHHYEALIEQFQVLSGLTDLPVVTYQKSFFGLRYTVEPYINELDPPRLLVYVPLSPSDTHQALIELQTLATEVYPGNHSPQANTRLALIARNSLKPLLGEAATQEIEKSVQAGKLSLAELDKLALQSTEARQSVLALIFGTGNAQETALLFLNNDQFDEEITRKDASDELGVLFYEAFGIESRENESLANFRTRLARYLLATDLLKSIQQYGAIPESLSSVDVALEVTKQENSAILARAWRLRRDLAQNYADYALRVEKELKLATLHFAPEQLKRTETFLALEKQLQLQIIEALLQQATQENVELAQSHQSRFWGLQSLEIQTNWASIAITGQVLLEAECLELALKASPEPSEIFLQYTASERPWCLLDTYHRHMELRYHNFPPFTPGDHLEKLLSRARQQYMRVGSILAEQFLRGFQTKQFQLPGVMRQVEIFEKHTRPALRQGKVAYILVDALRYEMGHELAQTLASENNLELSAALGTVPTITVVGMAALLPGAQDKPRLVSSGNGKVALELNGVTLKDRKGRIEFLKKHAGFSAFDARLDELLPKPIKRVQEGVSKADLIVITSQEIDLLGEKGNIAIARQTMEVALNQLQQAFRVLGQLGIKTIICTADHGYLFAEELSDDMKIDPPGGREIDLHRRVWIGQGGTAEPSYLRTRVSDFGLASDLDIAIPWNFACFKKQGGAEAYFHGGVSPQEFFIPVLTLRSKAKVSDTSSNLTWQLTLGSQKITTRLCSIQITGKTTGLFPLTLPKVRLELRSGQECISMPVSAAYGFEEATGNIQLETNVEDSQQIEPNVVVLAILKESRKASVSLHLLDAITGIEFHRLDAIEMAISI